MRIVSDKKAKQIIQEAYKDGFDAGIDRMMAQFSVAVNKKLIGYYPQPGINSINDALQYVLDNCFEEVIEFEKQMTESKGIFVP